MWMLDIKSISKIDETRHPQTHFPVCRCLALSAGFPKVAVLPWRVVSIDPLDCIVKFPLSLLRRTHTFAKYPALPALRGVHAAPQLIAACPEGAVQFIFLYSHVLFRTSL